MRRWSHPISNAVPNWKNTKISFDVKWLSNMRIGWSVKKFTYNHPSCGKRVLKKANKVHSFVLRIGVLWREKKSHDQSLFSSLLLPPLSAMIMFFEADFWGRWQHVVSSHLYSYRMRPPTPAPVLPFLASK